MIKLSKNLLPIIFVVTVALGCKKPVQASFELENYTYKIAEGVYFENTSLDAKSFSWNFGDGSTSSERSPMHVYQYPGKYRVTLTVNGISEMSKDILVVETGLKN